MFCRECGTQLKDGTKVCPMCGTPVEQAGQTEQYQQQNYRREGQRQSGQYQQQNYQQPGQGYQQYAVVEKKTIPSGMIVGLAVALVALVIAGISIAVLLANNKNYGTDVSGTSTVAAGDGGQQGAEVVAVTAAPTETATPIVVTQTPATPIPTVIVTVPATPAPQVVVQTSSYIFPSSNSGYLSDSEVRSLSRNNMVYARNEVYARRGRMFNDDRIQAYFDAQSWYTPIYSPSSFDEGVFNDYEKANVKLISDVEHSLGYDGNLQ